MARVWTDGAEMGDLAFWDISTGALTAATDQKRSGAYSYKLAGNQIQQKNLVAVSEAYFRFAARLGGLNSVAFFVWRKGATTLGSLRINSANAHFELYTSTGTLVATGTLNVQTNTWYLIELHIKIDNSGALELKVDGIADASFSGDTQPGADTTIDNVYIFTVGTGQTIWFDDLALNDTTGGADNSWCGDGRVIRLTPSASGDASEWTGSDGNQVDNYALVDEAPPNAADYVEDSTLDHRDLYALTDSGLTSETILRVWAEARAADTVADGGEIALVLKTESTEYDGADVALLTTYTKQVLGTTHTVNPNTSAAWTPAQLDALQAGPKTRS
jgi:hypothetical protein